VDRGELLENLLSRFILWPAAAGLKPAFPPVAEVSGNSNFIDK
jgi:hypothetical protein